MLRATLARNLLLETELRRVTGTFEDHGVEVLTLKGITLLDRIDGRIDGRGLADNDLLVRRADVPRAIELAATLGYAPRKNSPEPLLDADHQFTLWKLSENGAVMELDLHWNAFSPSLFTVPEELQWAHRSSWQRAGHSYVVLDEPLTVLHLVARYLQDGFKDVHLRELGSAWQLWHRLESMAALPQIAREVGAFRATAYALERANRSGHCGAPPPWVDPVAKLLLEGPQPTRPDALERRPYAGQAFVLALLPARKAASRLFGQLFPEPAVMDQIYGGQGVVPRRLRYLQRAVRPLRRAMGWTPPSPYVDSGKVSDEHVVDAVRVSSDKVRRRR